MFVPIVTIPKNQICQDTIVWLGPWFGDAESDSAGQSAYLQADLGLVPGYFSGASFVTRVDFACVDSRKAKRRAQDFAREMCQTLHQ